MKRKKWSVAEIEKLIYLKTKNKSWHEISIAINKSIAAVKRKYHYLQQNGTAPYRENEYANKIEEILSYYETNGHRSVLKKYGSYAIHYLKRNELWKRTQKKIDVYPERFLASEDRFYWVGFLAADGCIRSQSHISLGLSIKDKSHLVKLKEILGGGIYERQNRADLEVHKIPNVVTFLSSLNVIPRKTKILLPPINLNEDESRDYIRGYIDGDGCFTCSTQKRGNFVQLISINGTEKLLGWIRTCFSKWCKCAASPSIRETRGTFVLSYGSSGDFMKIGTWLYSKRKASKLERKYKRFFDICLMIQQQKQESQYNNVSL